MSALETLLSLHGVLRKPFQADSRSVEFPPFSVQVHGIVDAPYHAASTRVRVLLAHPPSSGSELHLFDGLVPSEGEEGGGGAGIVPAIDVVQADASECCGPWFTGPRCFAYIDARHSCVSGKYVTSSVVAVALVDMIDRRTRESVGIVGGCVVHLWERNGVYAYPLRRNVTFPDSQRISFNDNTLPLTSLVLEVHWGPHTNSAPNALEAKKLRAVMFGAVRVEQHVNLAPSISLAAEQSREDRRRLLYKNRVYRAMRPIDINLGQAVSSDIFYAADSKGRASDPKSVDSLGFMVFNSDRGACITIHELRRVEPLPCVASRSTTHGVVVPSPLLKHLMLFRFVVEVNGVVVGYTVRHDWDAPLENPKFPPRENTFVLSDDTLMDSDDEDDNDGAPAAAAKPPVSAKVAAPSQQQHPSSGRRGGSGDLQRLSSSDMFEDLGELQGVTCLVRVFAMIPNYKRIPPPASADKTGAASSRLGPPSKAAEASLLSRAGWTDFEPLNPGHYAVIPYAWSLVELVAPTEPFLKSKSLEGVPLFPGLPQEDALSALRPHLKGTATQVTLDNKLVQMKAQGLLPEPMRTTLVVSVADVSLMHHHAAEAARVEERRRSSDSEAGAAPLTAQSAWLGSTPNCTISQLEECLEHTFRSYAFE